MGLVKKEHEILHMRRAGKVVGDVLRKMRELVRPGVTTLELDETAERMIRNEGGVPAFKGYRVPGIPSPFPGTLCVSINEEIVHGIPTKERVVQEGDIVSIDVGVELEGYFGDAACTYGAGEVSPLRKKLMRVTLDSLHAALSVARSGKTLGDIGHAVETVVLSENFGLVRNYAGHGIGKKLHEFPQVPNYGKPHTGVTLKSGMTIAIEPMVMTGGEEVLAKDDRWTVVTADGSDAAHFEHSVLICEEGVEVLTPWEE
ncbi:MAG TPA: type I methionyl aminopeptidase [Synergistaceae bacterium]|nr:type I methionyl aminopeptidase [Synergistaceae bacterium]HPJ25158.1 type I methionyl aminopeptidase [Synergistaceae bacterium]HPQ36770.1 type I methionyl aminopeptidase [Synergistaceae bacterium]